MTDEQIKILRELIKSEIDCSKIDGTEHGKWGWSERELNKGWKIFQESFSNE
jgi:hypothetical protein